MRTKFSLLCFRWITMFPIVDRDVKGISFRPFSRIWPFPFSPILPVTSMSLFLRGEQRGILFPLGFAIHVKNATVFPDTILSSERERLSRMRSYVPRLMIFVIDTAFVRVRRILLERAGNTSLGTYLSERNFLSIWGKRISFI